MDVLWLAVGSFFGGFVGVFVGMQLEFAVRTSMMMRRFRRKLEAYDRERGERAR